jgi:hypothetical protein
MSRTKRSAAQGELFVVENKPGMDGVVAGQLYKLSDIWQLSHRTMGKPFLVLSIERDYKVSMFRRESQTHVCACTILNVEGAVVTILCCPGDLVPVEA